MYEEDGFGKQGEGSKEWRMELVTTKATILRTIREHCLHCLGGSPSEVEKCTAPWCSLYPYRFGIDPTPNAAKAEAARRNFAIRPTEER